MPRRYLTHFDYERGEVDQVLEKFRDPDGPVTRRREALFRRKFCWISLRLAQRVYSALFEAVRCLLPSFMIQKYSLHLLSI